MSASHSKTPLSDRLIDGRLSDRVLGCFFRVYNELGSGFLEVVYRNALLMELRDGGITALPEAPIEVFYRDRVAGSFRADILVEGRMILELKAMPRIGPQERRQLLNYLKASRIPVGFVLNFGPSPTFERFVHTKRPAVSG